MSVSITQKVKKPSESHIYILFYTVLTETHVPSVNRSISPWLHKFQTKKVNKNTTTTTATHDIAFKKNAHSGWWELPRETKRFLLDLRQSFVSCPTSNTTIHCQKLKCDMVYCKLGRMILPFFFWPPTSRIEHVRHRCMKSFVRPLSLPTKALSLEALATALVPHISITCINKRILWDAHKKTKYLYV